MAVIICPVGTVADVGRVDIAVELWEVYLVLFGVGKYILGTIDSFVLLGMCYFITYSVR